jgi:hypothetical protein
METKEGNRWLCGEFYFWGSTDRCGVSEGALKLSLSTPKRKGLRFEVDNLCSSPPLPVEWLSD